jgi:DNA-directed RNA polymerase specialized sigma24 family protein
LSDGGTARSRQKDWVITEDALNKLLAFLDSDRDRAGEKYEQVRRKLTKLFQWRGCSNPDEYVDRTVDRVARRIAGGSELKADNRYLYFYGVALNVLKEHWREAGKAPAALDEIPHPAGLVVDPQQLEQFEEERSQADLRFGCLERCIERLPLESRQLVVKYHGAESALIEARKRLASAMGIPLNTLRTRACRIRIALEACVETCMKRQGA